MKTITTQLEHYLTSIPQRIKAIPENELTVKPSPGKWSKKEIMGHLIDSAIYNTIRFTQAQYMPPPYMVEGYDQDNLVSVNNYQNLPLDDILITWQALNKRIVSLLSNLSEENQQIHILRRSELKTLGWLAEDYLNHMEHHLEQIFGKGNF